MQQGKFITDGIIDPAATIQNNRQTPSVTGGSLGFLDQLGGVATNFLGTAGSGLINKWFGSSTTDTNGPSPKIAEDQTRVLGDAQINQDTDKPNFVKQYWPYLLGGVVALGAVVYVAKK